MHAKKKKKKNTHTMENNRYSINRYILWTAAAHKSPKLLEKWNNEQSQHYPPLDSALIVHCFNGCNLSDNG